MVWYADQSSYKYGYCRYCEARCRVEPNSYYAVVHIAMCTLTCGLWFPLMLIHYLCRGYHCYHCGGGI